MQADRATSKDEGELHTLAVRGGPTPKWKGTMNQGILHGSVGYGGVGEEASGKVAGVTCVERLSRQHRRQRRMAPTTGEQLGGVAWKRGKGQGVTPRLGLRVTIHWLLMITFSCLLAAGAAALLAVSFVRTAEYVHISLFQGEGPRKVRGSPVDPRVGVMANSDRLPPTILSNKVDCPITLLV